MKLLFLVFQLLPHLSFAIESERERCPCPQTYQNDSPQSNGPSVLLPLTPISFATEAKPERCPCAQAYVNNVQESATPSYTSLSPQFWAKLGLGITQSRYAQSLPKFIDIAASDDAQGPTLQMQTGGWLHPHWGFEAYYRRTPAEFKNSTSLSVQNNKYNVQSIGAEVTWRHHALQEGQHSETFFKLGIHQHDLPFLIPLTPLILSRELNSLRTLSFAFETNCWINSRWRAETWLRYQYPFTAGSENGGNLDIRPNFIMDGSLGFVYRFQNFTTIGFYWTGQWYDANYKYNNDLLNLNFIGYQNLFLSTFDIKVGVEF